MLKQSFSLNRNENDKESTTTTTAKKNIEKQTKNGD